MTTHDYRKPARRWGHDVTHRPANEEGTLMRGSLWSSAPVCTGDFLLLSNGDVETRYRFTSVRQALNPRDMYHFEAEFAPRQEES